MNPQKLAFVLLVALVSQSIGCANLERTFSWTGRSQADIDSYRKMREDFDRKHAEVAREVQAEWAAKEKKGKRHEAQPVIMIESREKSYEE